MLSLMKNIIRDESGATAIEYGLIAALVSIAAIAGMEAAGVSLTDAFDNVSGKVNSAIGSE